MEKSLLLVLDSTVSYEIWNNLVHSLNLSSLSFTKNGKTK